MRHFRWRLATLGAALLLVGVGCGMGTRQHGGAAGNAGESFDVQFIDMMVPHHQGAVAMAQIAQQRGEHAEIQQLAGGIIGAQEEEIARMRVWRQAWAGSSETPPMDRMPMVTGTGGHGGGHSGSTMNMAEDVEKLRGAADPFDHAFIDAMIPHHQSAIEAANAAGTRAQRPEIKQLAESIISDQQREITQMEQWRDAWYGPHGH
jgi:uncharacterized protein (DUF305 family)